MKTYYGIAFVCLISLLVSLFAMNLVKRWRKFITILSGLPGWMGGMFLGIHLLFRYDEPYFRSLNNDTIGSPVMMIPFVSGIFIVTFIGERLAKKNERRSRR